MEKFIKALSIIYFVGTAISLILAILAFSAPDKFSFIPVLNAFGSVATAGGVLVFLAILSFTIGFYLWKLKRWALIVAGIFALLGLVLSLYSIIFIRQSILQDIVGIIVNGAIIILVVLFLRKNKQKKSNYVSQLNIEEN